MKLITMESHHFILVKKKKLFFLFFLFSNYLKLKATYNGHLEIIEYLFKIGVDFSIKHKDGWSALHLGI